MYFKMGMEILKMKRLKQIAINNAIRTYQPSAELIGVLLDGVGRGNAIRRRYNWRTSRPYVANGQCLSFYCIVRYM